ncbi:Ger(x)C family spore germination protein [Paenibacillus sp. MWE-103]|uniref:Ger(X)C family spore germination protein n=1 Tax=Paenibacillus artemisiicola TaxID=1172618 RepID=A0ABS3W5Q6_9BACL|nr:Ger(x)C family spore germination protein [Paenibacillus artemisiicola]MBO7743647.1 Ger(x)C family spore germination protein [Paenibacillus artemisiicola]
MRRAGKLMLLLLLVVPLTACWNLEEPDEQAFVLGAGLDYTKEGEVMLSSQIVIPSGIGGSEDGGTQKQDSFRMMKANGKNVYDAVENLQKQISRTLFFGHRQTIIIGHRMAVHGIGGFMDIFIRNPQSELRSTIFVVRNSEAKDIFTITPIFDPIITPTLAREIRSMGLKPYYFRDFLTVSMSQTTQPLVPLISKNKLHKYVYAGGAILNKDDDLKLIGFLDAREAQYANWILGNLKRFAVTAPVKNGDGNVSVKMRTMKHQVRVKPSGSHIDVDVHLTGKGIIVENNSDLDPTKRTDLMTIQKTLSESTQTAIAEMVNKVQKQYKADIFAFGENFHRQQPVRWKTVMPKWKETFPRVHITVKVDIQCKDPGQTSSSLKNHFKAG